MAEPTTTASLVKLADAGLTVADPAADVRNRTVVDRAGEEIGEVDDLLVDEGDEKVRFLQVAAGGFLGIGERHVLLPVDAVTKVDVDRVHVDQTRERILGAPRYDPALAPAPDYWSDLYGYYGYAPFWGRGYTYPPYPYVG